MQVGLVLHHSRHRFFTQMGLVLCRSWKRIFIQVCLVLKVTIRESNFHTNVSGFLTLAKSVFHASEYSTLRFAKSISSEGGFYYFITRKVGFKFSMFVTVYNKTMGILVVVVEEKFVAKISESYFVGVGKNEPEPDCQKGETTIRTQHFKSETTKETE